MTTIKDLYGEMHRRAARKAPEKQLIRIPHYIQEGGLRVAIDRDKEEAALQAASTKSGRAANMMLAAAREDVHKLARAAAKRIGGPEMSEWPKEEIDRQEGRRKPAEGYMADQPISLHLGCEIALTLAEADLMEDLRRTPEFTRWWLSHPMTQRVFVPWLTTAWTLRPAPAR